MISSLVLLATLATPAADLDTITKNFPGRVGACIQDGTKLNCTRGDERFSLQSVVKLIVSVAVLDDDRFRVNQPITVYPKDLSVSVQPIAQYVTPNGYKTTIGELIRSTIMTSDSAACDILIARLGGPKAVHAFLIRKGITGMRVDRDERHLQTETDGLTWRDEFIDPKVLEAAIAKIPEGKRYAAYKRYQADPRDTSTPKAMTTFLTRLVNGDLLPPDRTAFILQAMADCTTGADRLKAGTPSTWKLAHKTGSSGTRRGLTVATNDVGILTAPDGRKISIAVFVGDSTASPDERAAMIAAIAKAATASN
ncbi:beta-lactamase [Bryobacterales bacterium F-183]|nr:beta-lactamase [Bryobacterales bacterium F-183]